MAKTCPSCGYGPIGPFTDNCPICAEPVRNVRSDAAGRGGGGLSPLLRWVIAGAVIAVLSVVGCCGVGMWFVGNAVDDAREAIERARADAEAERQARSVVVAADQLLQEFQNDSAAADEKYEDKYLEISGVVERVGRDRNDTPFVILHAGDENAKLKVECFFDLADEKDQARVKRLRKGQAVTVRGEYDGRVSNVQVRECVLVE